MSKLEDLELKIQRLEDFLNEKERNIETLRMLLDEKRTAYDALVQIIKTETVHSENDFGIYHNSDAPEAIIVRVFRKYSELKGRAVNLMDENENLTDLLQVAITGYAKPGNGPETNRNLMSTATEPRRRLIR